MIPKFRAWDKARNKMNYKVMVGNCNTDDENWTCPIIWIEEKKDWLHFDDYECIMQSTGLFDKNGKEIFEGDVLKFNDEWDEYCHEGYVDGSVEGINFVEVVRGEACFEFGKTKYPESSLFIRMEDEHLTFSELIKSRDFEFEIISNIYENPELLEDKE